VVLPTHRLVHALANVDLAKLLPSLEAWFDLRQESIPADAAALRRLLRDAAAERPAFALASPSGSGGAKTMTVLVLRADFDPVAAGLGALPTALQRLDVALLHELVLERGLGITKQMQADKTNLYYYKSTDAALAGWMSQAHERRAEIVFD
jgi:hypothetical protein